MQDNLPSLLERLRELIRTLPAQQKKVAVFVLEHHKEVAFMTITELALKSNSSGTSVNRLCVALGYKGYVSFQTDLKALIQSELTAIDRVHNLKDDNSTLTQVFNEEAEAVVKARNAISTKDFAQAIKTIRNSRNVVFVGYQACEPIARYAAYTMSKIRENSFFFDLYGVDVEGLISSMNEDDVAIVFGLPRYPIRTTQSIEILSKRNVKIILITHSQLCPYTQFADLVITIPVQYQQFTDGLSPLVCFVNALVLETFNQDKEVGIKRLQDFEMLAEFVFENVRKSM